MTNDELHQLVHRWQPPWLRAWGLRHPGPYQALFGLVCLLVVVVFRLVGWPDWIAFAGVTAASALYEKFMTGPKLADFLWRTAGSLVFCGAGWLIWWALT